MSGRDRERESKTKCDRVTVKDRTRETLRQTARQMERHRERQTDRDRERRERYYYQSLLCLTMTIAW